MKSPEAFRSISEAADELGVPQHVLRFWETKFSFIRPMKRAGGRRFYRRQDIEVLRGVQSLLHRDGYTIKGVQRLHREQGTRRVLAATFEEPGPELLPGPQLQMEAGASPPPGLTDADFFAPVFDPARKPLLSLGARRRLTDVLADLEQTKALLDRELAGKNG